MMRAMLSAVAEDIFPEDSSAEPLFAPPPVGSDQNASVWARLINLKRTLPLDHEWAVLFHETVTLEVVAARFEGTRWTPTDPVGLGLMLEEHAQFLGLLPAEKAPLLTKHQAIRAISLAFHLKPVAEKRAA